MRRAPDRTSFPAVKDIAIAAHAGIAGPFVPRETNEPAGNVELGRQPVEFGPEGIGDLKVIALMADHVDERRVARVAEIGVSSAHADGLSALPVQIAPITAQRRLLHRA